MRNRWTYKDTKAPIRIGDHCFISKAFAKKLGVLRTVSVVDLRGFITVQLSDGQVCDFDERSITQCS